MGKHWKMKSLKKRKGVHNDFKRKKAKVGRKLRPVNATSTEFTTKSVFVAQQLGPARDGEGLNTRRQSLSDLLSQISHHSPKKRRDAVLGTKDLFQKNEELLAQTTYSWIRLLALMQDSEGIVRKAVKTFMQYAFQRCQNGELSPFLSVVISHFTSALSHFQSRVKMDTLVVLRMYLRLRMPSPKVYLLKLLPHFKIILQDLTSFRYQPSSSQFSKRQSGVGKRFLDSLPLLECIIEVLTRISELRKGPIGTPLRSSSVWCPVIPESEYARALYSSALGETVDPEEAEKVVETFVRESAELLMKLFVEATSEISKIQKFRLFALKVVSVLQVGVEFPGGSELELFNSALEKAIFDRGPWRNERQLGTECAKLLVSLGKTHVRWRKLCESI